MWRGRPLTKYQLLMYEAKERWAHKSRPGSSPLVSGQCWCVHLCACVQESKCAGGEGGGGGQFMSMVLKTHSVNFFSLVADVCDSSCSLWLSSHSLLTCPCSLSFSSRSWGRRMGDIYTIEAVFKQCNHYYLEIFMAILLACFGYYNALWTHS